MYLALYKCSGNSREPLVRPKRVELLTFWSVVRCSIQLSYGRVENELFLVESHKNFKGKVILLDIDVLAWVHQPGTVIDGLGNTEEDRLKIWRVMTEGQQAHFENNRIAKNLLGMCMEFSQKNYQNMGCWCLRRSR